MSVNEVIQNIDSLYNKTISVYGYYSSKYPFPLPECAWYFNATAIPRYHDSFYLPSDSGNHYLLNATSTLRGDTLEIRILHPYNTTSNIPLYESGTFVTLNGTLLKQY